MEDTGKSGFRIVNILLMESSFKRIDNVNLSNDCTNAIDVNTGFSEQDKFIICNLTVKYLSLYNGITQVESTITNIGVFEKIGESKLDVETFGKINAPSIIFPYIREHLSSLSLKAGINPVVLAPVNFVALAQEKKKGKLE